MDGAQSLEIINGIYDDGAMDRRGSCKEGRIACDDDEDSVDKTEQVVIVQTYRACVIAYTVQFVCPKLNSQNSYTSISKFNMRELLHGLNF